MMVPKMSLILAGAALFSLGSVAGAQANTAKGQPTALPGNGGGQPTKQKLMRRYDKPLTPVQLDLSTGTITRGATPSQKNSTTCVSFNNNDLAGFVGVDTGSCGCEWIDAGIKSASKSSYITSFTFAYCSAAQDTLSGGVGGAVSISFRSGYVVGVPGSGTELGRFCLTGLPANTACSSFFGGFRCFFITVNFNIAMCLPDGAIGWGWKFKDVGTDGVLGKTFPFLSCIASCSGGGPDGQGMVNAVDQYCPPGTLLSTFSFGTFSATTWTSFSMGLNEVANTTIYNWDTTPRPGGGPQGPVTLADISGNPAVCPTLNSPTEGARFSLNCSSALNDGVSTVQVRGGNCNGTAISTGFGSLWTTGPILAKWPNPSHGQTTVNTPAQGPTLPKLVKLICVRFCVQGFCGNGPMMGGTLSNALQGRIGLQ